MNFTIKILKKDCGVYESCKYKGSLMNAISHILAFNYENINEVQLCDEKGNTVYKNTIKNT